VFLSRLVEEIMIFFVQLVLVYIFWGLSSEAPTDEINLRMSYKEETTETTEGNYRSVNTMPRMQNGESLAIVHERPGQRHSELHDSLDDEFDGSEV